MHWPAIHDVVREGEGGRTRVESADLAEAVPF